MSRLQRRLLRGAIAVACGALTLAPAPSAGAGHPRTPRAAFPRLRTAPLSLLTVTGEIQAGDRGEVAIHLAVRARCALSLRGPHRVRSGPYAARVRAPYARWRWLVSHAARGGTWTATVTCVRGRARLRRSSRILVGVTLRNDRSMVARHSMRLSLSRNGFGPLGGRRSGKGGGSYPDDGALCEWTGTHEGLKGRCPGYDWGYLRPSGRWSLLSSRGFYYRNCTDYVAWFMGLTWSSFRFPTGLGNAVDWRAYAGNVGLQVMSTPSVGDIAWWGAEKAGGYGHVAIVTAVDASGAVTIAEYNGDGHGNWDLRPNVRADAYLHRPGVTQAPTTPVTPTTPTTPTTPPPSTTPTTPTQPPTTQPPTWPEQEGHLGVNTFTNPYNASGFGPRIGAGQVVQVSCKLYAPQIQSVNPDGYWYRIASGPWNGAYYSPANTFMNGDPWNGPYTHNTDFAVPNC